MNKSEKNLENNIITKTTMQNIIKKYHFTSITRNEMIEEMHQVFEEQKEKQFDLSINQFIRLYKLACENRIDAIIKKKISQKISIKELNEYINITIQSTNSLDEKAKQLKKIAQYIEGLKYNNLEELYYIILIKNHILDEYIYQLIITEYKVDDQLSNLIKAYCQLRNIKYRTNQKNMHGLESKAAYYREIQNIPTLTRDEEVELIRASQQNDLMSREKLIKSYLRLVKQIAQKYKFAINSSLTIDDIIQDGNIGLMIATQKYDFKREASFANFAVRCIETEIIKGLNRQSKTIRVAQWANKERMRIEALQTKMLKEGQSLTNEQLADILGIIPEKIEFLRNISRVTNSLNENINREDEKELIEAIKKDIIDTTIEDPIEGIAKVKIKETLSKVIQESSLTTNEKKVILLSFGFINEKQYSFREIGKILNLTAGRIYEIKNNALRKISGNCLLSSLALLSDYVNISDTKTISSANKKSKYIPQLQEVKITEEDIAILNRSEIYQNLKNATLSTNEKTIFAINLGAINNKKYTNEAISNYLGISPQRVKEYLNSMSLILESMRIPQYILQKKR